MPDINTKTVADHYSHGALLNAILEGVERLGKSPGNVTIEDLGPVDEFHIGGRIATKAFLDQLGMAPQEIVLDVGCGLGGASRFVAQQYGSAVKGIDLTPEYVEVGKTLCSWVGLDSSITLEQGDACATPYADSMFDKAYMLHVGMNIADKNALVSELHRILRPGGRLGIYDIMRTGNGKLKFPVPWATTPNESDVASPDEYLKALESAGFHVVSQRNRRDFALDFFAALQASAKNNKNSPPLGLHILMGAAAKEKIQNMINNIAEGLVAPVELIAEKPA